MILNKNHKRWLYSRGGRTEFDVLWINGKPFIEMSVMGAPKLYPVRSTKIKFDSSNKDVEKRIKECYPLLPFASKNE